MRSNSTADTSLTLPSLSHRGTLESLLAQFFSVEENPDYCCEHCPENGKGRKQLSITGWPSVLVITLDKFVGKKNWRQMAIDCPETLNFKAILPSSFASELADAAPPYSLSAVVDHIGPTLSVGRYLAKVKHGGHWYRIDNGDVAHIATPVTSSAYLLFYTKALPQQESPLSLSSLLRSLRQAQPEINACYSKMAVCGIPANVCSNFISLFTFFL